MYILHPKAMDTNQFRSLQQSARQVHQAGHQLIRQEGNQGRETNLVLCMLKRRLGTLSTISGEQVRKLSVDWTQINFTKIDS
jgi:hypothetical protein